MKKLMCLGVMAAGALAAQADVVTNSWVGADGGKWSVAANWSANHVPDGNEYVIFPDTGSSYSVEVDGDYEIGCFYVDYRTAGASGTVDFTLTGSGKVTATGNNTSQHCVRTNRRLVMDGPTLEMSGDVALLIYNGIVVKTGSHLFPTKLLLHWNGSYMNIEGGEVDVSAYTSYRQSHAIRVEEGSRFSSSALRLTDGGTGGLSFTQNGGEVTIGDVAFSSGSSYTMNGGIFKFRRSLSIAEDMSFAFNGGTNEFYTEISNPSVVRRFLTENENTVVRVIADKNVLIGRDCTITAPLEIPGGAISFTNSVTISATKPVLLKRFLNSSTGDFKPTLRFPTLVLNGDPPFKSGNVRDFFVEGPTTIRTQADVTGREGRAVYPYITGHLTVDTRDWNDPTVARTITVDFGPKDDATLTARGGGTVNLVQQYAGAHMPFRRVTVEEGTTLALWPNNSSGGTEGTLHAEELVLGPHATLNVSLYLKSVAYFAKLSIDPTATINVTVPDTFTGGGKAFLIGTGANAIADISGQINLVGNTAGCSVVRAGGSYVVVKKTVTEPDGTYPFEWTGGGGASANGWGTAANWFSNTVPEERQTHVFGAADAVTTAKAEAKLSRPTVPDFKGSTVGQIIFRDTAVASFTITGTQFTYNNRASDGGANSDLYSLSAFPQYVSQQSIRSTDTLSFSARGDGPLVISSQFAGNANRTMYICGDVRLDGASDKAWPNLVLVGKSDTLPQTCLSVLNGTMTFGNQTSALTIRNAGLRVSKGATLSFPKGTSSSRYQWTQLPQLIVVDGTLDIQAPFFGGKNQTYGGEGTLTVSQPWPSVASSRVSLVDTLTLESPAVWTTVRSDSVATPLLLGASSGRPVIRAANGWTYGPAEGVEVSPSADRAAYIAAGATLAIEPGGGVATFADPVAGPGTLEITNGTLKVTGGIAPETSLAVAANGTFAWDADTEVAGASVATGGTLSFAGAVLTVDDDVSLAGVTLRDANNTLAGGSGWHRVLVAKSVSGEPVMPPSWETRLVPLNGDMVALELHDVRGTMLIFR